MLKNHPVCAIIIGLIIIIIIIIIIGGRHEKVCSRISTLNGRELDCVFIVRANKFKCSRTIG